MAREDWHPCTRPTPLEVEYLLTTEIDAFIPNEKGKPPSNDYEILSYTRNEEDFITAMNVRFLPPKVHLGVWGDYHTGKEASFPPVMVSKEDAYRERMRCLSLMAAREIQASRSGMM